MVSPLCSVHSPFSGVTITEDARASLLELLHSELHGGSGPMGSWTEVMGVSREQYLDRLKNNQPVVEVKDIGAQKVVQAGAGVTWVPVTK